MSSFDPDWVIAPGDTLAEWFAAMHLPSTIAEHYGISQRTLLGLYSGKRQIGPVLAQKLCNMTHVGAPFWLALEHNYRVGLAAGKTRVNGDFAERAGERIRATFKPPASRSFTEEGAGT